MPLLQTLKALTRRPKRCGACLFELNPQAKTLKTDLDIFVGSAFSSSDTHTVSRDSLVASSSRGCEKCTAILDAVAQHGISFQTAEWNPNARRSGQGPYLELLEPRVLFELCTSAAVPEDKFSRRHMCLWNGAKISASTGGVDALKKAASWMDACRAHHKTCRSTGEFAPTRLLHMPEDDTTTIRLVENPPPTSYAALSHRWTAETQTSRLEQSNRGERLAHGIPLGRFPQTMQDAMLVARALGIRYIWIDSMCIVQDSRADWLREAASMASVYTHAELSIAASWCSSPGQSLFSSRTASHATRDITDVDGQAVFLRRQTPHFTWQDVENDWFKGDPYTDAEAEWPLLSRGWVYQEQLLSRRMLHFTKDEMLWECSESTICECRPVPTRDAASVRLVKQPVAAKAWSQVVREYAKRRFTLVVDRLPALAGVAKAYVAGNGGTGQYLCGLWADELETCFFWHVSGGRAARPDMYMPSWSWASTVGNIETWGVAVEHVQFQGHKVTYDGDEHMGDVRSGEVTLSGRTVGGTVFWKRVDGDGDGCAFGVVFEGTRVKALADYTWDTEGRWLVADGSSVVMLLFGQSTQTSFDPEKGCEERVVASCLVLRCVDQIKGLYERIGVTHGEGMDEEEYLDFDKVKAEAKVTTLVVL